MDDLPIGRRVAYWRGRRKMSQQQFADAVGKSKSWVDKVERGVRRLDKVSILEDIADALRVDLRLLLGKDGARQRGAGGPDEEAVDAVRGALARWGPARMGVTRAAPTLGEMGKAVTHAWLTYEHARYADLLRTLPRLLLGADLLHAEHPRDPAAGRRLAEVYQLTSTVMGKLGVTDLAWLAADRALTASQDTGDRLLTGASAAQLGHALLAQGQARHAMEVSIAMANRLAPPQPLAAPAEHLSVYGTLLTTAALGAAALGYADDVDDLLAQAAEASTGVDEGQDHYRTAFGPVAVELARVAATVELGDGSALDTGAHRRLVDGPDWRRLPPERRAAYLLDVARGHLQAGDVAGADQAVVIADRVASAEIRARPLGREVLATVLRRSPTASADVLRVADEAGVSV
ncbi:helix-turn-helix domain-containing protein [Micromonospora sp. DT233]|uniref:helix-turn-helix domain-containing protein n=1 Tax=Micromonospora sp. DT233 TaxID=3393432 RepID=UPI003CEEC2F5